jgi:hypothetical protein
MTTTRCLGRISDYENKFLRFGDEKHKFTIELRCSNSIVEGTKLCSKCHGRPREGRTQTALLHGLINEPIPPWSYIFEGARYWSKVATYGEPDKDTMAKAKAAQAEANKGIDQLIVPVVEAPKKLGETEKTKTKPKRAYKKKVQSPEAQTEAQAEAQKQTIPQESESPPKKAKVPTQAIESIETPIDDKEIVKIVVRPFDHDGRQYFIDYNKNKLYSVGKDKRPLAYYGRWDPAAQTIDLDIHDSDIE